MKRALRVRRASGLWFRRASGLWLRRASGLWVRRALWVRIESIEIKTMYKQTSVGFFVVEMKLTAKSLMVITLQRL